MNANSQAQGGCVGCAGGIPNYKNDIIINIVERLLPQGLAAWKQVAAEYQRETGETTLCQGEDLQENWNKKLCNHMQEPTGKPGALQDRIFRCIDIERCIQAEANAAILGVDLAESGHSCNDGSSNYSDVIEEECIGANDAADSFKDSPPFASIEFNDGRVDEAGEEDEEVAAANIAVDVVILGEGTEGAAEVRPIHRCCLHLAAAGVQ